MIKRKRKLNKQAIIRGLEFFIDPKECDLIVVDRFSGYVSGAIFHSSAYPRTKYGLQCYFYRHRDLTIFIKCPISATDCTRVLK